MKWTDLNRKQMNWLAYNRPGWLANHRPEWMAINRPKWMAINRPEFFEKFNTISDDIVKVLDELEKRNESRRIP